MKNSGELRYGSDMEGGGPYAYPDPNSPRGVTGFEVELMALLAHPQRDERHTHTPSHHSVTSVTGRPKSASTSRSSAGRDARRASRRREHRLALAGNHEVERHAAVAGVRLEQRRSAVSRSRVASSAQIAQAQPRWRASPRRRSSSITSRTRIFGGSPPSSVPVTSERHRRLPGLPAATRVFSSARELRVGLGEDHQVEGALEVLERPEGHQRRPCACASRAAP